MMILSSYHMFLVNLINPHFLHPEITGLSSLIKICLILCVVVSGLILFNPPTMKAQTRPAETTNPSPKVFFSISSMSALKYGICILQKFNLRILMILE